MTDTEHRCTPPERDPEDRTSWSARRWDCPDCGVRWIYVQRMIRRKIHGGWRIMPGQPTETDKLRDEIARLRVAAPPAGLPATLAAVEDVGRVCEAADLMQYVDRSPIWRYGHVIVERRPHVIIVWSTRSGTEQRVAELGQRQPGWLLWHAIRAARGGARHA